MGALWKTWSAHPHGPLSSPAVEPVLLWSPHFGSTVIAFLDSYPHTWPLAPKQAMPGASSHMGNQNQPFYQYPRPCAEQGHQFRPSPPSWRGDQVPGFFSGQWVISIFKRQHNMEVFWSLCRFAHQCIRGQLCKPIAVEEAFVRPQGPPGFVFGELRGECFLYPGQGTCTWTRKVCSKGHLCTSTDNSLATSLAVQP